MSAVPVDQAAPVVTYVTVPPSSTSAASVLEELRAVLVGDGPVHLCREVPRGAGPKDLASQAVAAIDGEIPVDETWATDAEWLARAMDLDIGHGLAARLIVRVPWPLTAEAEQALLLARLSLPPLRLAVPLDVASAEAIFWYLNRLAFDWIAMPPGAPSGPAVEAWAPALAALVRTWCVDPRSVTRVEPIISAFGSIVASGLGSAAPPWRYRVVEASTKALSPVRRWTPSVHALLLARPCEAPADALERVAHVDSQWTGLLGALCERLDVSRLDRPAPLNGGDAVQQGSVQKVAS